MTESPTGIAVITREPVVRTLLQYSYLQILDFLTTIAFLVNGVKEGNPLVRFALTLHANPLAGLALIKVIALMLGIYCWRMGRQRVLWRVNLAYAVLIAWNLVALIVWTVAPHAA